ncbi:hypothetical protein K438DRAFT_1875824 [Mycena galopus ATCC 62051]|nr:hypothetical protein K438DRAFT_1875824 [Mycena galopus ATCC 62051]
MSSFNIVGFFQLKDGRRVSVSKPNSNYLTYFAHYNTNLRVFITSNTPMLPDRTVASAVCTAQSNVTAPTAESPASNSIFLDALTFVVLPGNPSTDSYNDQLPDEFTSMAYGVGRVSGSPQVLDDGHASRVITVGVSDYVRGDTKASTVQCIFDLSTARWTRAPTPLANTVMQFYGLCRDLNPAGTLRIKVESTALNIGSNAPAPTDNTQTLTSTSSAPVTPAKWRKFDPPSPSSGPGPSPSPSTSTSTPTHSPSKPVIGSVPAVPDVATTGGPMHYAQLFNQYPQYLPWAAPAFTPPFVPQHNLYTPGYSPYPPPFPPYSPFNSKGEFVPTSIDTRTFADAQTAPSTRIPDPATVTAPAVNSTSALVQEDSAFNRSAANPYSYPMTQMQPTSDPPIQPASSSSEATPITQPTPSKTQEPCPTSGPSTSGTVSSSGQGPVLRPRKN